MIYNPRMLAVGTPAPAFSASDQEGKTHALSDAAGSWLVLYFYPADDTPGCTKEACGFRDKMGDVQKLGAIVWGVSPDSTDSHAAFAKKYSLNFPLLADPSKAMHEAYKITKRMTYIVDPKGVIANAYIVQDAEEHPEQILDDLMELMKG